MYYEYIRNKIKNDKIPHFILLYSYYTSNTVNINFSKIFSPNLLSIIQLISAINY